MHRPYLSEQFTITFVQEAGRFREDEGGDDQQEKSKADDGTDDNSPADDKDVNTTAADGEVNNASPHDDNAADVNDKSNQHENTDQTAKGKDDEGSHEENLIRDIVDFNSARYNLNFEVPPKSKASLGKFRNYVHHPDPRPFYGCSFCGPNMKHSVGETQINGDTCPACALFHRAGWRREYDASSNELYFYKPDGSRLRSVREYMSTTTKIICDKLNAMFPGRSFPDITELPHYANAKKKGTPKEQKRRAVAATEPIAKREKRQRQKRMIESEGGMYCDGIKRTKPAVAKKQKVEKVAAMKYNVETTLAKKQKVEVTDMITIGNQTFPRWAQAWMKSRKQLVCGNDPRPEFGWYVLVCMQVFPITCPLTLFSRIFQTTSIPPFPASGAVRL